VGPCLDVYALSARRDRRTIAAFLGRYVKRSLSQDAFEELMVLPAGFHGSEAELDDLSLWEWVPVSMKDEAVEFGLANQTRAFRLYLPRTGPWCGALLAFTCDGQIVLGVSVDDPLGERQAMEQATALIEELMPLTDGPHGWIVAEEPPPLDPMTERPWERALASTVT
jgi:hypothetical protein